MEIVENGSQRYFSYAGGGLMLLVREMILDTIEDVKQLNREQKEIIIKDGGLEVPPQLEDEQLVLPAMSFVQNEWYKATSAAGTVPERVVLKHQERVNSFMVAATAAKLRPAPAPKPARSPGEPRAPREPRPAKVVVNLLYEILPDNVKTNAKLASALDMKTQPVSHDGIILQELERAGAALTLAELVKEVEATKRYQTNDPLEKSVKWHLGKLVEKQYVKAGEAVS